MADWGGIARAVEEGLLDDTRARDTSSGGLRDIAEALTGQDFAGFKMRDIFDKDRWSRRERENQGKRLEETGIPDYTYDYNPRDQAVLSAYDYGPPVVGRPMEGPPTPSLPWDKPRWDKSRENPLDNIRQWGTQNPNVPGSMALDPTWAGGLRGAGLGAEMTPGQGRDLSKLSREPGWSGQGNPGQPLGVTGYLPGKMSVGEARRARAMRNMSRRDRATAGLGDLERYDEFGRISGQFDERMGRLKDKLRDWDIEDRTRRPGIMGGGPSTRIQPDWQAIEEDMAIREMADRLQGRDDR